jgi:hypothetical protein
MGLFMTKTHFFIVGAPKCGTTSLAEMLASHPGLCVSEPKEPHFFDVDYPERHDQYMRTCFSKAKEGQLLGEATPSYLMVPYVANNIRNYNPDAKIIILLRDPVDRAFSSWWMLKSRGMEKLKFIEAIEAEFSEKGVFHRSNIEKIWAEQVNAIKAGAPLPLRTYLEAGFYAKHLKRYYEMFPSENIKVILTVDLKNHPEKVLNEIIKFLGLEQSSHVNLFVESNRAVGSSAEPILRALRSLGLMGVRHFLPQRARNSLKSKLSSFGATPSLTEEERLKASGYFSDANSKLEMLLDRKLLEWR